MRKDKHKVSDHKPCGKDIFSVSCREVFISALYLLSNPMEPESFMADGVIFSKCWRISFPCILKVMYLL